MPIVETQPQGKDIKVKDKSEPEQTVSVKTQPIVEDKPDKQENSDKEKALDTDKADKPAAEAETGEVCWNCRNHDPKTSNRLDAQGNCKVCGFEKDKLYNGNIEAAKQGL